MISDYDCKDRHYNRFTINIDSLEDLELVCLLYCSEEQISYLKTSEVIANYL